MDMDTPHAGSMKRLAPTHALPHPLVGSVVPFNCEVPHTMILTLITCKRTLQPARGARIFHPSYSGSPTR